MLLDVTVKITDEAADGLLEVLAPVSLRPLYLSCVPF